MRAELEDDMKTIRQWLIGRVAASCLVGVAASGWAGGIPEPGLTMYGVIRNDIGGASVRMSAGTLTWTMVPPSGPPVTVQTELRNINDQFSYVVDIPFESPVAGVPATSNALQMRLTAQTFNRALVFIGTNQATLIVPAMTNFTFSSADRANVERVDLLVAAKPADSDGDGLPDYWEDFYFSGFASPDDDSADHDGVSNLREYLAGTDPTDTLSVLEFVNVARATGGGDHHLDQCGEPLLPDNPIQ
jgi:hypothetical protein